MTKTNLALWDSLEKTDPAFTREFQRPGGFKGTAINGTYVLKRLTEAFGPCGKGWKFVVDDEQIVDGHKLKSGDISKLHVIRGHLEYMDGGEWKSTSPQFGQTMLVGENRSGPYTDEEAPKKSITDAISKCAVLVGIGADVHLGLFDDNKYVNERRSEEKAEAQREKNVAAQPKPADDAPAKDRDFARNAYQSIIDQVGKCEVSIEIDTVVSANKANMEMLKKDFPNNYKRLEAAISERRKALGDDVPADDIEFQP